MNLCLDGNEWLFKKFLKQARPEFTIHVPYSAKCWDYENIPPCPAYIYF
jgi:hypothetical protein